MEPRLYTTEILRLAMDIPLTERLAAPKVTITKTSRICGSRVECDVRIERGVITAYGQTVKACALGQASCAIVGANIIGETLESFAPIAKTMRAMLLDGDEPPAGKWAALGLFLPARAHKSRHTSIMLPFEALMQALSDESV